MPHEVELSHWPHPRLPATHPLSDRWTVLYRGKPLLTFGSKGEALEAVLRYGWTIAGSGSEQLA